MGGGRDPLYGFYYLSGIKSHSKTPLPKTITSWCLEVGEVKNPWDSPQASKFYPKFYTWPSYH